jgi:hypothetical protein
MSGRRQASAAGALGAAASARLHEYFIQTALQLSQTLFDSEQEKRHFFPRKTRKFFLRPRQGET